VTGFQQHLSKVLALEIRNSAGSGALNDHVGAEHVQKAQYVRAAHLPSNMLGFVYQLLRLMRCRLLAGSGGVLFCFLRQLPAGFDPAKDTQKKCASMDGDADRLVYFFVDAAKVRFSIRYD